MKILVLHGAVKNSGDFLIRDRSLTHLRALLPHAELIPRFRLAPLGQLLNQIDLAVLAGGPALDFDMVPTVHPRIPELRDSGIPTVALAIGLSGHGSSGRTFSDDTSEAIRWLSSFGRISVRDINSARAVDEVVAGRATMTGCVAWYLDLPVTHPTNGSSQGQGHDLAFTPPANPRLHPEGLRVLRAIGRAASHSKIVVGYHRGILPGRGVPIRSGLLNSGAAAIARLKGATVRDLSGPQGEFDSYDDCRIHIGYRVHAHLLFLSQGKPSILIAEDRRGRGQQVTLDDPYRLMTGSIDLPHRTADALETETMEAPALQAATGIIRATAPTMIEHIRGVIGADWSSSKH